MISAVYQHSGNESRHVIGLMIALSIFKIFTNSGFFSGIVSAYGQVCVQVTWWALRKVCPSCFSETVRYRRLILGRDIGLGI